MSGLRKWLSTWLGRMLLRRIRLCSSTLSTSDFSLMLCSNAGEEKEEGERERRGKRRGGGR